MLSIKNTLHNLDRFLIAQESTYQQAFKEISEGQKISHWMWYIFPQISGLGKSNLSIKFALNSADEANEYLNHTILGKRLKECTHKLLLLQNKTAYQIFGHPDDLKFHSSMTLFLLISNHDELFQKAIKVYFKGELDEFTILRLKELV